MLTGLPYSHPRISRLIRRYLSFDKEMYDYQFFFFLLKKYPFLLFIKSNGPLKAHSIISRLIRRYLGFIKNIYIIIKFFLNQPNIFMAYYK